MKSFAFFTVFLFGSHLTYAQSIDEMELDCSKAVVGFLKEKGVITGGEDGLCIGDLKSLPKIHVGLGSNTFPLGNADQFNVSKKTQDNLQTIQEVLRGKNSKAEVSFVGYADGEQNNIAQFDSRFLKSGESSYTKNDLKNKIADTRTLKTILDLLKSYPDDAKIPYDQSRPELKTAQSLIRNYYLANDRAKKVCQTALPAGTDCDKAPIQGYASPDLETNGNKQCGPRRRAFMTVDLSPSGMKKAKNNTGRFSPHFEIPNPMEYQRDLQIAASLDLFSKLAKQTGSTDISKYKDNIDLILPPECQSNPNVLSYIRSGAKRLISDVSQNLGKVTDAKFKESVLKGNYKEIKKKLEALNEKEELGKPLTAEELAQQKVIEIVTSGSDRGALRDYDIKPGYRASFTLDKKIETVERTLPDGRVEVLKANIVKKKGYPSVILYTNSGEKVVVNINSYQQFIRTWKTSPNQRIGQIVPADKKVEAYNNDFTLIDNSYPDAGYATTPSTDLMNCFSAAEAIEENLKENADALTDASLLVSGEQAKLNVGLNSLQVAHLEGDHSKPRGWACTKCQSGIKYDPNTGTFDYKARDYEKNRDAAQSVFGQHNTNSLTVGSLKNLKVFNISREAFDGKCPDSKSVCDCVKDQGGLEKLLNHSTTEKISLLGEKGTSSGVLSGSNDKVVRWDKSWTFPKPENHCIFTPPVPHTCQVDPKGRSQESKSNARNEILACQILDNIKAKYNLPTDIDVKKYKNVVLGSSLCRKSLPTTNEEQDCGFKKPNSGSSGAGKVSNQ